MAQSQSQSQNANGIYGLISKQSVNLKTMDEKILFYCNINGMLTKQNKDRNIYIK